MNYVILGASAAGISCAKTLRTLDKSSDITIISRDTNVYSRCMLHYIISGSRNLKQVNFTESNFFEKYNVSWINNVEVTSLDVSAKSLILSDNRLIYYDKLLIATGASSFFPNIKNLNSAKNIFGLRNIEDAIEIKNKISSVNNVAIVGAGLVGIDALVGLMHKNLKISVLEASDRILPIQLDKTAAEAYESRFISYNVDFYKSARVVKFILNDDNSVKALELATGEQIEAEMVIMATGVKPNVNFISPDSININKGISVNNKCETNIDSVYAAGDVLGKSGIWPLAVKQGIVAANNMLALEKTIDDDFGLRNSMNFLGIPTVSIGFVDPPDDSYNELFYKDEGIYKKIIYKDSIIYGAIFQGDINYTGIFLSIIKDKTPVVINESFFEQDYSTFLPEEKFAYDSAK